MVNTTPTLWVSVDRQPFKMAHIPSTFNHVNYFVDSVKSLQALVIVQHDNNQYNLYMSEEMGVNYYLALADVAVAVSNAGQLLAIDLQPVSGELTIAVCTTLYISSLPPSLPLSLSLSLSLSPDCEHELYYAYCQSVCPRLSQRCQSCCPYSYFI